MNRDEAVDYHSIQLATLKAADADLAWALTFGDPEEAIGVCTAAKALNVPLAVSSSLGSTHRLNTGMALSDAVDYVDSETGGFAQFCSLTAHIRRSFYRRCLKGRG